MNTILKYHGGKYYLKKWIVDNFPAQYENMDYYEPFIGGGSILLHKKKAKYGFKEKFNDLNQNVYLLWSYIQKFPHGFKSKLKELDYSKETFNRYLSLEASVDFDIAIKEFVLLRMSRGGLKKSFAWSERLRGGIPGDVNAWNKAIKGLMKIHERIYECEIYNTDCISFLAKTMNDKRPNLVYLDPPYLKETRVSKKAYGDYEMTKEQHIELLKYCRESTHNTKMLISGYDSELYNTMLSGWNKTERSIVNHASQTKKKTRKVECLWKNY